MLVKSAMATGVFVGKVELTMCEIETGEFTLREMFRVLSKIPGFRDFAFEKDTSDESIKDLLRCMQQNPGQKIVYEIGALVLTNHTDIEQILRGLFDLVVSKYRETYGNGSWWIQYEEGAFTFGHVKDRVKSEPTPSSFGKKVWKFLYLNPLKFIKVADASEIVVETSD